MRSPGGSERSVSRRAWLAGSGVGLAAAIIGATTARAASAKVAQTAVGYQHAPNAGQRCALCASFVPPETASGVPACKLVEGPIDPQGWCQLFARR
jgi:hypothetical protein